MKTHSKFKIIKLGLFFLVHILCISTFAQTPQIGAQVFIEPGQTYEQIEHWFKLLNDNDMRVCRIRMFESHMKQDDGTWDFSLYDHAFAMAEKYNVKILATLFPADESLGGFKFPRSDEHQKEIEIYIRAVVTHFKDHPALDTWVLLNEPGSGYSKSEYSLKRYEEWKKSNPVGSSKHNYMKKDYSYELFWRDYTTNYLSWLADVVRDIDKKNMTHLNNHMLFLTLREYDFDAWKPFLSTFGASIHAAWHLGYFTREQYNLAIAANCDFIRGAAEPKPFWVTELQGGPNTFSGFDPLTPYKEDIAQWLWICNSTGAKRTIFWSLNARASDQEAGEWALVDFQSDPTERLTKAGEIAAVLKKEEAVFSTAMAQTSNITLLYSPHSMITFSQKVMSSGFKNEPDGRTEGAHIKSVLAYYKVLSEMGISANVKQLAMFDWEKKYKQPQTVVLANMISIPEEFQDKIKTFVKNGNKLIVSGMSTLFDEHMHNVYMSYDPYRELFGATLNEFHYVRQPFTVQLTTPEVTLNAHLMQGTIQVDKAQIIASNTDGVFGVKNTFGKGQVYWIPSNIALGAWLYEDAPFARFVSSIINAEIEKLTFTLDKQYDNVLLKVMKYDKGYITILINSTDKAVDVKMLNRSGIDTHRTIYSDNKEQINDNNIKLSPRQTYVLVWEKQ